MSVPRLWGGVIKKLTLVLLGIVAVIILIPLVGLKYVTDWGEALNNWVQIVALGVGAWWTYITFIKKRTDYPYAKVEHNIEHYKLTDDKVGLTVKVSLTNHSEVMLRLKFGKTFVQQICPLHEDFRVVLESADDDDLRNGKVDRLFDEGNLFAYNAGVRERDWGEGLIVEPGECQPIVYDFVLDKGAQIVKVVSYFRDEKKSVVPKDGVRNEENEVGWIGIDIYKFEKEK